MIHDWLDAVKTQTITLKGQALSFWPVTERPARPNAFSDLPTLVKSYTPRHPGTCKEGYGWNSRGGNAYIENMR